MTTEELLNGLEECLPERLVWRLTQLFTNLNASPDSVLDHGSIRKIIDVLITITDDEVRSGLFGELTPYVRGLRTGSPLIARIHALVDAGRIAPSWWIQVCCRMDQCFWALKSAQRYPEDPEVHAVVPQILECLQRRIGRLSERERHQIELVGQSVQIDTVNSAPSDIFNTAGAAMTLALDQPDDRVLASALEMFAPLILPVIQERKHAIDEFYIQILQRLGRTQELIDFLKVRLERIRQRQGAFTPPDLSAIAYRAVAIKDAAFLQAIYAVSVQLAETDNADYLDAAAVVALMDTSSEARRLNVVSAAAKHDRWQQSTACYQALARLLPKLRGDLVIEPSCVDAGSLLEKLRQYPEPKPRLYLK